jgi:hypothetical protein
MFDRGPPVTREEQKEILRQQRAGFETFRKLEIQADRATTVEERLAGFERIQEFAALLPYTGSRVDDDQVTQTWIKIRSRYDATKS